MIEIEVSNIFTGELPGDAEKRNFVRQVYGACYSETHPKSTSKPAWVHFNDSLAEELNLSEVDRQQLLPLLSGNADFEGFTPYAMCYGGHQFGNWAGQLGDGRAINVAEVEGKNGTQTLQLKGSGMTPYSRHADGLAVLRSSIREYLCSEAMFHLGVPTTRALSLVLTGDQVERDVLYNGNPEFEKGAIVCRVSRSFLRFGNFQIFASRNELDVLKKLLDFTIQQYFPHLGSPNKEVYLQFFAEVVSGTLDLMLEWERVGFVHGVMNTDNMSILSLTIDYGPYGWLEDYDPTWTPNTTDSQHKRYRYGNQAQIGLWNLLQLGNALFPVIEDADALEKVLLDYQTDYLTKHLRMIWSKLGFSSASQPDEEIVKEVQKLLYQSEIDMTIFFRNLNKFEAASPLEFLATIKDASYSQNFEKFQTNWEKWLELYAKATLDDNQDAALRIESMNKVNPKYVLRNYMAQLAIDEADKGNYDLVDELYRLLQKPYDEQPEMEKWFAKRPDWAKTKVGCSMLSCSS